MVTGLVKDPLERNKADSAVSPWLFIGLLTYNMNMQ